MFSATERINTMSEKILAGKVALVTGSSRGIGKAYATVLAQAGADVIIHDKTVTASARFGECDSAELVVEEMKSYGVRSKFYAADISKPEEDEKLIADVIRDFGHIDILVNNAGGDIGAKTPRPNPNDCIDIAIEDIQSVLSINLMSTMYMCKYAAAHMRERKSGKIINIGSIGGHMSVPEGVIYGSAKCAIEHYTRCLAEELRPYDVNVNCIAPGKVLTARIAATRTIADETNLSRLQRFVKPEELAKMILFLAGGDSDFLTGETIVCWA